MYKTIDDHTQMKVGDLLEYRCPRFGLVTQWRVKGIHPGALRVESLIELSPVTNRPAPCYATVMVPVELTRNLTIIRSP